MNQQPIKIVHVDVMMLVDAGMVSTHDDAPDRLLDKSVYFDQIVGFLSRTINVNCKLWCSINVKQWWLWLTLYFTPTLDALAHTLMQQSLYKFNEWFCIRQSYTYNIKFMCIYRMGEHLGAQLALF